jgi:hypothetical protein
MLAALFEHAGHSRVCKVPQRVKVGVVLASSSSMFFVSAARV